jgi:hypothetical protein
MRIGDTYGWLSGLVAAAVLLRGWLRARRPG